jgi:DNA-directed RNA polymerase specialized sigma24 family protein
MLERRDFSRLHRERGRFRAFLLAALQHFLLNEAARQRTQKRGGRAIVLPLQTDDAEGRYIVEPADPEAPETLYERRWALTVTDRVLAGLREERSAASRGAEFDALKARLLGQTPPGGYAAVAGTLGIAEGAVKTAVHRLRRKFQVRLRAKNRETVSDAADVDDEIRYLLHALEPHQ